MKFNWFTETESEVLNEMAEDVFGVSYDYLDDDDQNYIQCLAMDGGLI